MQQPLTHEPPEPTLIKQWDHYGIDCQLFHCDDARTLLNLGIAQIVTGATDILFETVWLDQQPIYTLFVQRIPDVQGVTVRIKAGNKDRTLLSIIGQLHPSGEITIEDSIEEEI